MTKDVLVDEVLADLIGLAERAADGFRGITGQDIVDGVRDRLVAGDYIEAE